MTTSNIEEMSDIEKARLAAVNEIERGMNVVGTRIDKMTSASLKRVLKGASLFYLGQHLVSGKKVELNEDEQMLIDKIFALQEGVVSFMALEKELSEAGEENNTNDDVSFLKEDEETTDE